MKHWLIAAAALLSIETAALACSCLATDDPVELKRLAAETGEKAVALVEVETIETYAQSNGAGEKLRVVQLLAGAAPVQFRVQRNHLPSSASCDILYEAGQRYVMILYPASQTHAGQDRLYNVSGLCTAHLLDKAAFRDAVIQHIGDAQISGERG